MVLTRADFRKDDTMHFIFRAGFGVLHLVLIMMSFMGIGNWCHWITQSHSVLIIIGVMLFLHFHVTT
jgi:hypothetical protein